MAKALKARVVDTGKVIKVHPFGIGYFEDKKTRILYDGEKDLQFLPRYHMKQIGFSIGRFGMFVFAREYWKYKVWYLIPGVAVSAVNGYDRYVDIEVKILFIGLGIRFIWVKKK